MHAADPAPPTPAPPEAAGFAGFWRRCGAFVLDGLLLGLIGQALGLLAFEPLVQLGSWGRLLGFAIALAYFTLLDSRLTGGQTPGKRAAGLRLADRHGAAPTPARAAARFAVLGPPWLLNGAALSPAFALSGPGAVVLSLLVFGVGGAVLYLLVFNRPTRQSLHDLATGLFVVRVAPRSGRGARPAIGAAAGAQARPPSMHEPESGSLPASAPVQVLAPARIGPRHVQVVAVWLVVAATAPLFFRHLADDSPMSALRALQTQLVQLPGVRAAGVVDSRQARYASGDAAPRLQHVLLIRLAITSPVSDAGALATRAAGLALAAVPAVAGDDMISVTAVRGFDIGLAAFNDSNEFVKSPAQWRDRVAAGAPG